MEIPSTGGHEEWSEYLTLLQTSVLGPLHWTPEPGEPQWSQAPRGPRLQVLSGTEVWDPPSAGLSPMNTDLIVNRLPSFCHGPKLQCSLCGSRHQGIHAYGSFSFIAVGLSNRLTHIRTWAFPWAFLPTVLPKSLSLPRPNWWRALPGKANM